MINNNTINNIKKEEGFRAYPYKDSLGIPTIGYGTKLPITEEEATFLLNHRLNKMLKSFVAQYGIIKYDKLDYKYKEVLSNMIYQLGQKGTLNFKKLFKAMEEKNDLAVIKEMRNSLWYQQSSRRVERLIKDYILASHKSVIDRSDECQNCQ